MKRDKIFAEQGMAGHELTNMLDDHKASDAPWNQGKTFGFVYHPGNQNAAISEAYRAAFQYESTLNGKRTDAWELSGGWLCDYRGD